MFRGRDRDRHARRNSSRSFRDPALCSQQIDAAIDAALNKIIDLHFVGVRMDHVHLVVATGYGVFEYPIDFDANEFHHRSNASTLQGSGETRAVRIDSKNVVGGSVGFFTLPSVRP